MRILDVFNRQPSPPPEGFSKIFVSHSSADKDPIVRHLVAELRRFKYQAWFDEHDIRAAQSIPAEVGNNLVTSDFVLAVFSPSALKSSWFEAEISTAMSLSWGGAKKPRIVPILFQLAPEELPALLQSYKAVTFPKLRDRRWKNRFKELLDAFDPLGGASSIFRPRSPHSYFVAPSLNGPKELVGREGELLALTERWNGKKIRVLVIVGEGGSGKTSLVAKWVAKLGPGFGEEIPEFFEWSFYSQGTSRDRPAGDGEAFTNAALNRFGAGSVTHLARWGKGEHLANLVAKKRSLVILDGLEPLQSDVNALHGPGKVKVPEVSAFLRGLAQHNLGLCIVTTRVPVFDLNVHYECGVEVWDMRRLSPEDGELLLRNAGVTGEPEAFLAVVKMLDGHALTLTWLGSFLRRAHQGDIAFVKVIPFSVNEAPSTSVMNAYGEWLMGPEGNPLQYEILQLLAFFDRPASPPSLTALIGNGPISGLSEVVHQKSQAEWDTAVDELQSAGLVSLIDFSNARNEHTDPVSTCSVSYAPRWILDSHPLLREYFAQKVGEESPQGWREGHGRLYDHLVSADTFSAQDGIEGLQPLYHAVYHGSQAGRKREAFNEVFYKRIQRREEQYSTKELGAFSADLGALACLFDILWSVPSPDLSEEDQAWVLNHAAVCLWAVGRLDDAAPPMQLSVDRSLRIARSPGNPGIRQRHIREAAARATNLSELDLARGAVDLAVTHGKMAIDLAQEAKEIEEEIRASGAFADALHAAGKFDKAKEWFLKAESLQKTPYLHSLAGFQYCDLILAPVEMAVWNRILKVPDSAGLSPTQITAPCDECNRRANFARNSSASSLEIALNELTLARSKLYRVILLESAAGGTDLTVQMDTAVRLLRSAGYEDELVRGLLTRALLRSLNRQEGLVEDDLREARKVAERGGMRLLYFESLLYTARLFYDESALKEAQAMVASPGWAYLRRAEELRATESALSRGPL